MVVDATMDGGSYKDYILTGKDTGTFKDEFAQLLQKRMGRFHEDAAHTMSPNDRKLAAIYKRLTDYQEHPDRVVRTDGSVRRMKNDVTFKTTTIRDLFYEQGLSPNEVRHLFVTPAKAQFDLFGSLVSDFSFEHKFNKMLNQRIRDVVYYGSPAHSTLKGRIKEFRKSLAGVETSTMPPNDFNAGVKELINASRSKSK